MKCDDCGMFMNRENLQNRELHLGGMRCAKDVGCQRGSYDSPGKEKEVVTLEQLQEIIGREVADCDHIVEAVHRDWLAAGGTMDAAWKLSTRYATEGRFYGAFVADRIHNELQVLDTTEKYT